MQCQYCRAMVAVHEIWILKALFLLNICISILGVYFHMNVILFLYPMKPVCMIFCLWFLGYNITGIFFGPK